MSQKMTAKGDALWLAAIFAIVGLIAGVIVAINVFKPEPESWRSVMAREAGITSQLIPLTVVDCFDDAEVDGPALLVAQQDDLAFSHDIQMQYVSPDGKTGTIDVPPYRLVFRSKSVSPAAKLSVDAWVTGDSIKSNLDAFLSRITVNQDRLAFYRFIAGMD